MSEFLDRISKLSPQRLALLADELNERLQVAERSGRVPIAIVGIGCRLPGGVESPEDFWNLLRDGVDAISEVPASRWNAAEFYDRNPDALGKMSTRWGGFIDGPDQFDPKFFGIAPAEANSMDPQQRLLLETSWESLEHAGIAPSSLMATQTGIFVGICNGDYSQIALNAPREEITPYFASGLSHAVAAGRISYVLGLQGPCLAVDTSCSASLIAVHLACQSLRLRECDTALAGGVNLILNPDITIALSQSKMMAPDGRCKAFSDAANGFVRAEGCGMIVLKRLPDALRDGNRILAVIRGSASNQDGRSSGLTAPNGPSQEAVIAAALANAGLLPEDVDAIEAHGTGTALGDPIEAEALNAVFANGSRRSGPLFVGSVKTNLGHLESAAGIAGLIKMVLSLEHKKIPASLHLGTQSRRIEWDRLPMEIPTELQSWNRRGKTRIGGVSSFGFSGTNAHVIVEELSVPVATTVDHGRPLLFMLSAKTSTARTAVAERLHRHLVDHPSLPLADVARTLNVGRAHFEFRAAVTAASQRELLERLESISSKGDVAGIEIGKTMGHSPRVALVFGGENWERNTGRELYERASAFRNSIERCEETLRGELDRPMMSVLDFAADRKLSGGNRRAADFAFHYALAELWRCCGIEPAAVLGYGAGELVAACVAGLFSLKDGLRLAITRGDRDAAKFEEIVRSISYDEPRIPLILDTTRSNVKSPEYWLSYSGDAGLTSATLSALHREGAAASIYIGGSDGLNSLAKSVGKDLPGRWLASFGDVKNDSREFLRAAGELYVLGCELDMSAFDREAAHTVALPTYPFERERYWIDVGNSRDACSTNRIFAIGSAPIEAASDAISTWVYDLEWKPKPLAGKSRATLDEDLLAAMAVTPASVELERAAHLTVVGKPLYSTYILRALQAAGIVAAPDRTFTLEELREQMRVIPGRRRLLKRLLTILVEDEIVERAGDQFRFVDLRPHLEADGELKKLAAEFPEFQTELNILRRCGNKLLAVLRGEYDPMQLVFADGSIDEAEQIYERSAVCRFFNDKAARVVRSAVDPIVGRPVRLLEIGAGTGATTTPILSGLAGKDFEYTFTDISGVFLSRARSKFARVPSMVYRLLNIENDPVGQGFEAGGYDVILAANVLHATVDLQKTLVNALQLLAPGGVLLLIEGVWPDRWLDLTLGLTDGWFRFADLDLRPDHPLVSVEKWAGVLREVGMSSCRTIAYAQEDGSLSQQRIIVAQVDADEMPSEVNRSVSRRDWMILADNSGVGDALHNLLTAAGETCELVRPPNNAGELGSLSRRLRARRETSLLEIVYLWGLDVSETIASTRELLRGQELCSQTLMNCMRLLLGENGAAHLSVVTRGAQATESFFPTSAGAVQSMAWGVGRVFAVEAPQRFRSLIDLDPAQAPRAAATTLFSELAVADGEDQVAYRGGQRLVPRLRHSSLNYRDFDDSIPRGLRADGSYLLVGGLGGLGLQLAKWAATQNPGHLILLGRTGTGSSAGAFAAERTKVIREIQNLGINVTVVEGDVASETEMSALFRRFNEEFPPLRGIFHAATLAGGADIGQLTNEQIEAMLRPKVTGAWILHELTRHLALDFFLVYSSYTSLLGSKWMAHYAAANQFLDAFAHTRRAAGLPMLSVNWGAWDALRLVSRTDQALLTQAGILPMPSEQALAFFPDLIRSRRAQVMIADIDWNILKPLFEVNRRRPLLEELGGVGKENIDNHTRPAPTAACLLTVVGMASQERRKFIQSFVQEQAARVLGLRHGELPSLDVSLPDLGLDSLMAVDLKNRLQTGLGQELSPTTVFDYPTVSDMVGMLETMLWARHGSAKEDFASAYEDVIRI